MAVDFGPGIAIGIGIGLAAVAALAPGTRGGRLGVLKVLKDFMFGLTVAYLPCWRRRTRSSHSYSYFGPAFG